MKRPFIPARAQRALSIKLFIFISLLFVISFIFGGCSEGCEVTHQYTYMEPVYTPLEELRSSVAIIEPQEIKQAGKIFFKGNTLYINAPNEGVHVINNQDPSNPQQVAFIVIPGAFDLAVKDNILFADSYIDLIAIDISDPNKVEEVGRIEGIFDHYNSFGFYTDPGRGVVTSWEEVGTVDILESDCAEGMEPWGGFRHHDGLALESARSFDANMAVAPTNPGIGGSMARFALSGDYLYVIDMADLQAVDVSTPSSMTAGTETYVDWGIETLFPKGDVLFIGAQAGMHIMDISDPLNPNEISKYEHVTSCDPVIVDGNHAFVTLRSGTECQGFTNQLEVIDITDLASPQLLHTYPMNNPHGLGKDRSALFICDGDAGLKVYNAQDIGAIDKNLLVHYPGIQAFDVIPFNNVAMMIGQDGLYQYDYSDLEDIKLLSHISVKGREE